MNQKISFYPLPMPKITKKPAKNTKYSKATFICQCYLGATFKLLSLSQLQFNSASWFIHQSKWVKYTTVLCDRANQSYVALTILALPLVHSLKWFNSWAGLFFLRGRLPLPAPFQNQLPFRFNSLDNVSKICDKKFTAHFLTSFYLALLSP